MEPHSSVCTVCSRPLPEDSRVDVCAACVRTARLGNPTETPRPEGKLPPAARVRSTPDPPPAPAPTLPKLAVVRRLGVGGMGAVYLAVEADVRRLYGAPHEPLNRLVPDHGVPAPAWNPRAAIGVWSRGSAVAVRNLTVVPLK